MISDQDKGGWVVCERRKDPADGREKFFYVSRRYATKADAAKDRDRKMSTPEYQGHLLEVTYERNKGSKPKPRFRVRQSKH